MARYRSFLALILAFFTVVLVSCSSADSVAKAPTYSAAQLANVQTYASDVQAMRDRLPELASSIQNRNWTNVRSLIHGPLGELRVKMSYISRNLLPADQAKAVEASKGIFGHLNEIDEAAQAEDYRQAIRNYAETIKDFDAFFAALPKA